MHIFDRILGLILRPWFIIGYLFLSIVAFLYLDKNIAIYFHSLNFGDSLLILTFITNLGMSKLYLFGLPLLSIGILYFSSKKNLAIKIALLWFLVFYASIITFLLKNLLGRARPQLLFDKNIFGFFGWNLDGAFHSFPSGHTTVVTSLLIGLTILFPRHFIYWLIFAILVMLTRILLTFHYLSDVLVTSYIIFLEMGLLVYIARTKFPKTFELILK